MHYQNVELHNVAEVFEGSAREVLSDSCYAWAVETWKNPDIITGARGEGLWISRVPCALRDRLNPLAHVNALQAAGCEARFNLKSGAARLALRMMRGTAVAEVWQGSFLVSVHPVGESRTELVVGPHPALDTLRQLTKEQGLPFDADLVRIVLPWRPPVRLIAIEGDLEPPRPGQTPAGRCLFYGSSITHGNMTVRPTGSYALRTAWRLGVDAINLGFGGGAHLEREMADYIAGRTDWDFAVLEMGINILNIPPEEFRERVEYFVRTVSRAHPDKWIFCVDVYTCRDDLLGGGKAVAFREVVGDVVGREQNGRLVHVDGRRMLPTVRGLTADLVHPSPDGMEMMADNLSRLMAEKLGVQRI